VGSKPEPGPPPPPEPAWLPHRTVNIDRVEYVAPTRTGVVIVARRTGREYSINLPRSEIAALAAKLRRPSVGATGGQDPWAVDERQGALDLDEVARYRNVPSRKFDFRDNLS
jgi:hypothetical protein